jgi:acyl transferase domain-containing protein/NAD(P)H-dependent flavin oxidoreductase YrpB (nitropropane dioxygenase family)/NAD(P)-dependent dehydrogenase (short-subunit alcohol dehydrogenase family)
MAPEQRAHPFFICCLHPAEAGGISLAIAAQRAGGVGILDISRCTSREQAAAIAELRTGLDLSMLAATGLRLRPDQFPTVPLDVIRGPLLCSTPGTDTLAAALADGNLQEHASRLYIEIASLKALDAVGAAHYVPAGLIARSQESGGWAGDTGGLVLMQALLAADIAPVWVQGGIGPVGIAACAAAGAQGVVLDDQLLLLAESPLKPEWQDLIEGAGAEASELLGENLGAAVRVLRHPKFRAVKSLRDISLQLEQQTDGAERAWNHAVAGQLGFRDPSQSLWPIGQACSFNARLRDRYRTVGRLIGSLAQEVAARIQEAATHAVLEPNAPLARQLGCRYPILQGPMTRVSDTPAFAAAVAQAGALPCLALGVMTAEQTRGLLTACRAELGANAWAVGVLGFLEPELLESHLALVEEFAPNAVILGGGRPAQAQRLEARGITTYVHAPTPALLRSFIAQGVRRFVFEGRECGGHVGPMGALALWEMAVDTLLAAEPDVIPEFECWFAGGIHDAASAALAALMATPLVKKGAKAGILMGTAYLLTREAVDSSAIKAAYQLQALQCRHTVVLESAPGHANRCADTPFALQFQSERRNLMRQGVDGASMRAQLDALLLGRLRLAAKGLHRAEGASLQAVEAERQVADGMFMIGACAALQDRVVDMQTLHERTTTDAMAFLKIRAAIFGEIRLPPGSSAQADQIAIVGMSALAPGAEDVEAFWNVLLAAIPQITEIPPSRWDWRLYYSPDSKDGDRLNSKWGGFFPPILFDAIKYGIPPKSIPNIAPAHLVMLELTRRALVDAGYDGNEVDHSETGVVFAAADVGGYLGNMLAVRSMAPLIAGGDAGRVRERTPAWSEETFAGILTSVTAGRVANRFNCGGPNLTIDSACASSLSAVDVAVGELARGRANMVIVGGLDLGQSPHLYMGFSRTGALSPRGQARVFDQDADGIVISEGAAVLILKRLADAERDGDRIYAVIRSVAGSSDGRAMGITAPDAKGQMRAMHRAYDRAHISAASVGLYEAHGTGTKVGDQVESESFSRMLEKEGAGAGTCVLGSLKSICGHTKTAAGMLSLIKTSLSLHHAVLPPHAGVKRPLPVLSKPDAALRLLLRPEPWLRCTGTPRRAAVSAFGFGGTNSHVVLEEYRPQASSEAAPGGAQWPAELVAVGASTRAALRTELMQLKQRLQDGARPRLRELAAATAHAASASEWVATAVVANLDELREGLSQLISALDDPGTQPLAAHLGCGQRPSEPPGKTAWLFPGQGSQYVGMGRELCLYAREAREALETANACLAGSHDRAFSAYIFPPAAFTDADADAQRKALTATQVAQPAIAAISTGFMAFLSRLGFSADMAAGHSFGELTALHAAGVLALDDLLCLAKLRGDAMSTSAGEPGEMAAIFASRDTVAPYLEAAAGVVIANHNSDKQVVISGPSVSLRRVRADLERDGFRTMPLPVSQAFHSPLMHAARDRFSAGLATIPLQQPRMPVYHNSNGQVHGFDVLRERLAEHLISPVEFVAQVKAMVAAGARVFVEAGPGRTMSTFIENMGLDVPVLSVSLDSEQGGFKSLLSGVATLWRSGVDLKLVRLFDGRVRSIRPLQILLEESLPPRPGPGCWMVDGQNVWPATQPRHPDEPVLMGNKAVFDFDRLDQESALSQVPSAPAGAQPPGDADRLAIYEQYAETMRVFLASQEQVIHALLGQAPSERNLPQPSAPAPRPVATAAAAGPVTAPARPEPPAPPAPIADMAALLLECASKVTGYPKDMLTLTADLESELGVDSIKRVEILEHLSRAVIAAGGKIDGFAADLPRRRTLGGWLECLPSSVANAAPVTTHVKDSSVDWAAALVQVVSNVTGYPRDLLSLEQDLEADLGINSIKRFEILDELARAVPAEHRARLQEQAEVLSRLRRLEEWAAVLTQAPATPAAQADSAAGCSRFLMVAEPAPLPPESGGPLHGSFVITRDALGVCDELAALLELHGATATVLDNDPSTWDRTALAARLHQLRQEHGPVGGVIHLAGMSCLAMPTDLAEWRLSGEIAVKRLFHILQFTREDLETGAPDKMRWVLSATMQGGHFGRDGLRTGVSLPTAAGAHGLLRTAEREWPSAAVRVVDFAQDMRPLFIAQHLIDELLRPNGHFEIGYRDAQRWCFVPQKSPLSQNDPPELELPRNAVILATGGARGITSALLGSILKPGMHAIVVGRTELDPASRHAYDAFADAASLRQHLIDADRTRGLRRTPGAIESELRRILVQREIDASLSRLRGSGARVDYHACDVSDAAFGGLVEGIYAAHGQINLVLHGAGIIEDKLLKDKTPESFDRVFDTKVNSVFALLHSLRPDSLRAVVLFASTAGRFGNRGQGDYAAANEVLNGTAWEMRRRWPGVRVVAVNWGPWSGVGMAGDVVNREFARQGIVPITVEAGQDFLLRELAHGTHDKVEVIAGDGPWDRHQGARLSTLFDTVAGSLLDDRSVA